MNNGWNSYTQFSRIQFTRKHNYSYDVMWMWIRWCRLVCASHTHTHTTQSRKTQRIKKGKQLKCIHTFVTLSVLSVSLSCCNVVRRTLTTRNTRRQNAKQNRNFAKQCERWAASVFCSHSHTQAESLQVNAESRWKSFQFSSRLNSVDRKSGGKSVHKVFLTASPCRRYFSGMRNSFARPIIK